MEGGGVEDDRSGFEAVVQVHVGVHLVLHLQVNLLELLLPGRPVVFRLDVLEVVTHHLVQEDRVPPVPHHRQDIEQSLREVLLDVPLYPLVRVQAERREPVALQVDRRELPQRKRDQG